MRPWRLSAIALLVSLGTGSVGYGDQAPSGCPKRTPHPAGAVEPLFEMLRLDGLERLRADFSEEKHIALLARPLRSTGTLYFERTRGMARLTRTPAPERVVLSTTTLRIEKADKVEEVPLDKSKTLRGFALIFPALLRGDRASLEATFDLELDGVAKGDWSMTLLPKDPALCGLLRRVVVTGKGAGVKALRVEEASGDTTETRLSRIARNEAVPPAEIAQAFGAH
jgi:Outer membrane lipoprotein carrier protein LolA-like